MALGSREFPYIQNPDAFFAERIHRYHVFVAELNGEFAGFVDMEPALDDPHTAIIAGIAVRPEFRGRGIGSALLGFAVRYMRAMGFRHAVLYSLEKNAAANELYRSHDFQVTKRQKGVLKWERDL